MKNRKNLSALSVFFFISLFVCIILIMQEGSSKDKERHISSVLTLTHQTLTSGTANARNNSTSTNYVGTVTGAKITFSGMPEGTYTIKICGYNQTHYNYNNSNFYYNGNDQGAPITLGSGICQQD